MPERFGSIKEVVGKVSADDKTEALAEIKERFYGQRFWNDSKCRELIRGEKEKTQTGKQIIALANRTTNELLKGFGLPAFNVPAKNFHIISEKQWNDWQKKLSPEEQDTFGFFLPLRQSVSLCESSSNLNLFHQVLHEMLTFKAYGALQVRGGDILDAYRGGLSIYPSRDPTKSYFDNLDEAVTEETNKRLILGLKKHPLFAKEFEETDRLKREYYGLAGAAKTSGSEGDILFMTERRKKYSEKGGASVFYFCYERQRAILNALIDKLFERNKGQFENREQVFDVFAKAMFSGNILPLGRLIDGSFGKGTFRKIGELDDSIDEQENFVGALCL